LLINDPVLNGTVISIELPNEGSKLDFESQKNGLMGHCADICTVMTLQSKWSSVESLRAKEVLTLRSLQSFTHKSNIDLLRTTFG
jgi:hypothetical protein